MRGLTLVLGACCGAELLDYAFRGRKPPGGSRRFGVVCERDGSDGRRDSGQSGTTTLTSRPRADHSGHATRSRLDPGS